MLAEPAVAPEPAVEIPATPESAIQEPVVPAVEIPIPEPPVHIPQPAQPTQNAQVSTTPPPVPISNWTIEYQPRGNAARKQKVEQRLEKIVVEVRTRGKITNREAVALLRVSQATAARYLRELVSRGKLQKMERGRSVTYSSA